MKQNICVRLRWWPNLRYYPGICLKTQTNIMEARRTMALGSTQPLTEMNTRNLLGSKGPPARKADKHRHL
jgi:hypothetical protein